MDILGLATRIPLLVFGANRYDDDFADRMNYKYTVAVLVIFAIVVTNRQFGQKQIHCWVPAYFTRNYEDYINDICWVSNTYHVDLDKKLPEREEERKSTELRYYQWVPFILLLEAVFFYIPNVTWRALSRRSGLDLRDLIEAANNFKSVDKFQKRNEFMNYLITSIDQYVDDPRRRKEMRHLNMAKRISKSICICFGKFLGNYLVVLYTTIKILYILNCVAQIFFLNVLLGHPFHKFGYDILEKIVRGKGWESSSRMFPKISHCDFRIREVGNPKISHRYTVQCVLPINLFNQQIFTFIWFWYSIILCINIYSLFIWLYRFMPGARLRYIRKRIQFDVGSPKELRRLASLENPEEEPKEFQLALVKQFVKEYLEPDGAFMLRVISSNVSDFVCAQLIQELWRNYLKERKFNRATSTDDNDDDDTTEDDDESSKKKKESLQDVLYAESQRHNSNTSSSSRLSKLAITDDYAMERKQPILKKSSRSSLQRIPSTKRGFLKFFKFRKPMNQPNQQQQLRYASQSTSNKRYSFDPVIRHRYGEAGATQRYTIPSIKITSYKETET